MKLKLLISTFIFCTLVFVGLSYSSAHKTVSFTVNTTADMIDVNPGDGLCATSANECSLRAAVIETNNLPGLDTINLPAGTYHIITYESENNGTNGDIDIRDDLNIIGEGSNMTFIDAYVSSDRIIEIISPARVNISYVTLQNGYNLSNSGGGAVKNGSHLILNTVVITNNQAPSQTGGGILNEGRSLILINTKIVSNTSDFGGGVYHNGIGQRTMIITDTIIMNNRARFAGGGVYNEGSNLSVAQSAIISNTATFGGGGIFNSTSSNSNILTVINTTFGYNSTTYNPDDGGVIYNDPNGIVNLINVTVNNNSSTGAILYNAPTGLFRLKNTIIANDQNTANCSGMIISDGYNLDSGTSCGFAAIGDQNNTNPMLGSLTTMGSATPFYPLAGGSPALNAGDPINCPLVDQRGVSRPQNGRCDIGSYEAVNYTTFVHLPLISR